MSIPSVTRFSYRCAYRYLGIYDNKQVIKYLSRHLRAFHTKCWATLPESSTAFGTQLWNYAVSISTATDTPRLRRYVYTLAGSSQRSTKWSYHRSTILNIIIESSKILGGLILLGITNTQRYHTHHERSPSSRPGERQHSRNTCHVDTVSLPGTRVALCKTTHFVDR